jgi:hypothetical protein
MRDMVSIDQENLIAEQDMRIAKLEAKLNPPPPPNRVEEPQVRVYSPPPKATGFISPTALEMEPLYQMVTGHWPALSFASPERQAIHFESFVAAFNVLAFIPRQETLNSKVYSYHWIAVGESIQKSRNISGDIRPAFLCAALAHGDILVSDWTLSNNGVLLEYSLNECVGRLPVDQWRRTLHGQFTTPIIPERLRRVFGRADPLPVTVTTV